MRKVKYKVIGIFGDYEEGTIIDAYLLCRENLRGLIFHPKLKRGECASIEMAILEGKTWVSAKSDDPDTYLNLNRCEFVKYIEGLIR